MTDSFSPENPYNAPPRPNSSHNMSRECVLSEDELRSLLPYYQELLGLRDWDIVMNIYRKYDMPDGIAANCTWVLLKKTALIKFLDHRDYDPAIAWPHDMEITLVHELLHPHFSYLHDLICPDEKREYYDIYEEQAIHAISTGIVAQRRGLLKNTLP